MTARPPMILTDDSNAFAHDTMSRRLPANIREIRALNPDYSASIHETLEQLALAIEANDPVQRLDPFAPDYELWERSFREHAGHTWQHTDWFFAEIAAYRHIVQAVRWWETGRDPFWPKKAAEMGSEGLWTLLDEALALRDKPLDERLLALIHLDLWGNRIDLSFQSSLAHGSSGSHEDLLVNDDQQVVEHLMKTKGAVHFIADNTGTELAMDLALADALFDLGVSRVTFHIKMHPTFVSDTTVPDMHIMFNHMTSEEHGFKAAALGGRLRHAFDEGRLILAPDFFWNSPYLLRELPARLYDALKGAALVISKGDLNYRRMVDDALWPPETPYAEVTDYFPSPLLTLRTMKSDAVVGLQAGLAEQLDSIDARWRVNGKRGVLQFRP
ncbi:MAG: damage-control phosphatase ARMT1 family protein [Anaerolineae bacterium]